MTTTERIAAINKSPYYKSPFNTFDTLSKGSDEQLTTIETFIAAEAKKHADALRVAARARLATPPDGYALGLAKRRTAADNETLRVAAETEAERLRDMVSFREQYTELSLTPVYAALNPATSDVYANPPDPYALALAQRKEAR